MFAPSISLAFNVPLHLLREATIENLGDLSVYWLFLKYLYNGEKHPQK